MRIRILILIISLGVVAGCGSAHSIKKPLAMDVPETMTKTVYKINEIEDPENLAPQHMRSAILGYLRQDLAAAGMLSTDERPATRIAKITIKSYRMRSGFTRAMFGIFAGKDGLTSNVSVLDINTKEILGESEVSCYNLAAIGGEEDIARMHGQEIAKFLSGKEDKKDQ